MVLEKVLRLQVPTRLSHRSTCMCPGPTRTIITTHIRQTAQSNLGVIGATIRHAQDTVEGVLKSKEGDRWLPPAWDPFMAVWHWGAYIFAESSKFTCAWRKASQHLTFGMHPKLDVRRTFPNCCSPRLLTGNRCSIPRISRGGTLCNYRLLNGAYSVQKATRLICGKSSPSNSERGCR